jgi:hypothetical protein
MAAKIHIKSGPDADRVFILSGMEVQIGRAPSSHIKLTDPAMQGSLKVEFHNGAYQVVNEMPNPIYLNKAVFGRGERRTWFHGHILQPTHDTTLELVIDDSLAPAEAGRAAAFEVSGKTESSAAKQFRQLVLIVVLFSIAGIIWFWPVQPGPTPELTFEQQREEIEKLCEQLGSGGDNRIALIRNTLRDAWQNDFRGHVAEAYEGYTRVRDEVHGVREAEKRRETEKQPPMVPEKTAAALEPTWQFVNLRLNNLSNRLKR